MILLSLLSIHPESIFTHFTGKSRGFRVVCLDQIYRPSPRFWRLKLHIPISELNMTRFWLLFFLTLGAAASQQDAFQSKCADFANKIDLPDVTVNLVNYVPGGANLSLPDNPPSCGEASQAVTSDICRIAMAVSTSDKSQITLEAWLPREYTGRFLSTGNGGLGGCMSVLDEDRVCLE